jgi:glycogen debranching enzyme
MSFDTHVPSFSSDTPLLDAAYKIAATDLLRSIAPYKGGTVDYEGSVFMAGEWYTTPWTRDAAINVWNGAGLFYRTVARDTLRSVLARCGEILIIDGEYWDAIIWTIGAWEHYLYSGDRPFLGEALEATRNSLQLSESTEFSPELGLFRGPAVYGDGVSGYPDIYARTAGNDSSIKNWPAANANLRVNIGEGNPMHALSTNCLYVEAYRIAGKMARELGKEPDPDWLTRGSDLQAAINRRFWMDDVGRYRYLVDPFGGSDMQEGIGHAFALLFGIADSEQITRILPNLHIAPAGIPCLWPSFDRYLMDGNLGRHSGTVWPFIQAFWGQAAARWGDPGAFCRELFQLASHAVRDDQFFEIYHPETGVPYGGLQERRNLGIVKWEPMPHQTWSATGFIRMVLMVLVGLRFDAAGIQVSPLLPPQVCEVTLTGLHYRSMTIDVNVRVGSRPEMEVYIDGASVPRAYLPTTSNGHHSIEIVMPHAVSETPIDPRHAKN